MNARFCSVDWGTTRLRVRLVQTAPFAVRGEAASDSGVAATHAAWLESNGRAGREAFFAERLAAAIGELGADAGKADAIVVSGMASSSIGMRELPYAPTPIAAEPAALPHRTIDALPGFAAPVVLVSGVATDEDVVRGEETELAGLAPEDGLYVLPGTHSKHLSVIGGRLTAVRTWMTGELFQLLSRGSVLSGCVAAGGPAEPSDAFVAAAREAIHDGDALARLFSVRARALLNEAPPEQGAARLSGLLIGAEVRGAAARAAGAPIVLSANDRLRPLYEVALSEAGAVLRVVDGRRHAEAVPRAHAALLASRGV